MKQRRWLAFGWLFGVMACGGGRGPLAVEVTPAWGDLWQGVEGTLTYKGTLLDESGRAVSEEQPATAAEGKLRFSFKERPEAERGLFSFHAGVPSSVIVGQAKIPVEFSGETVAVTLNDGTFFEIDTLDNDGDRLSNLSEVVAGLNPQLADSDGDGVDDRTDLFPLVAVSWSDLDRDGVADQQDDDIDGDGFSNQEERERGSNPEDATSVPAPLALQVAVAPPDQDGDGVSDEADNCPAVANPDQSDTDEDGDGNACDDDDDGDELSDVEEVAAGEDGVVTDPLRADSDGDTVGDATDNCPINANPDQNDEDADRFGVPCDCDDRVATTHPLASDEPDLVSFDQNCDGIDGESTQALFVDASAGSDQAPGTREAPLQNFTVAFARAVREAKPVYVAAGNYSVENVVIPSGLRLYGGYQSGFARRDPRNLSPTFQTWLTRQGGSSTLILESVEDVVIDGLWIEDRGDSEDPIYGSQVIVVLRSQGVVLRHNNIRARNHGRRSVGLRLIASEAVRLEANRVFGGAAEQRSVGTWIEGGEVTVANNLIDAGEGRKAIGVWLVGGASRVVNNTVLTEVAGPWQGRATVYGAVIDGGALQFLNNAVVTAGAGEPLSLVCFESPAAEAWFANNILAQFPVGGPLVLDCRGDLARDADFSLGAARVSGNLFDPLITAVEQLLSPTDFTLVGLGIDQGLDTASEERGGVVTDYLGRPRTLGRYDIGAVERP